MARLVVLLAVIALGYFLWQDLKNRPPEQRRKMLLRSTLWGLLGVILVLAATGRIHWIMAAGAALIPFIKILFGLLFRGLPFFNAWRGQKQNREDQEQQSPPIQSSDQLTDDEAWQLLGLERDASKEEIIHAHKRLMQKLHPDRGGNDYLAAKLNAARDLLLKKLEP